MQTIRTFARVATALVLATSHAAAQGAKRPMSFDDIMAIRNVGAVALSPDGRQVVFAVSAWEHPNANPAQGDTARGEVHENRSHLWLVSASGGAPKQLTFG